MIYFYWCFTAKSRILNLLSDGEDCGRDNLVNIRWLLWDPPICDQRGSRHEQGPVLKSVCNVTCTLVPWQPVLSVFVAIVGWITESRSKNSVEKLRKQIRQFWYDIYLNGHCLRQAGFQDLLLYFTQQCKKCLMSGVYKCYAELVHVPEGHALVLDLEVKQLLARSDGFGPQRWPILSYILSHYF